MVRKSAYRKPIPKKAPVKKIPKLRLYLNKYEANECLRWDIIKVLKGVGLHDKADLFERTTSDDMAMCDLVTRGLTFNILFY